MGTVDAAAGAAPAGAGDCRGQPGLRWPPQVPPTSSLISAIPGYLLSIGLVTCVLWACQGC